MIYSRNGNRHSFAIVSVETIMDDRMSSILDWQETYIFPLVPTSFDVLRGHECAPRTSRWFAFDAMWLIDCTDQSLLFQPSKENSDPTKRTSTHIPGMEGSNMSHIAMNVRPGSCSTDFQYLMCSIKTEHGDALESCTWADCWLISSPIESDNTMDTSSIFHSLCSSVAIALPVSVSKPTDDQSWRRHLLGTTINQAKRHYYPRWRWWWWAKDRSWSVKQKLSAWKRPSFLPEKSYSKTRFGRRINRCETECFHSCMYSCPCLSQSCRSSPCHGKEKMTISPYSSCHSVYLGERFSDVGTRMYPETLSLSERNRFILVHPAENAPLSSFSIVTRFRSWDSVFKNESRSLSCSLRWFLCTLPSLDRFSSMSVSRFRPSSVESWLCWITLSLSTRLRALRRLDSQSFLSRQCHSRKKIRHAISQRPHHRWGLLTDQNLLLRTQISSRDVDPSSIADDWPTVHIASPQSISTLPAMSPSKAGGWISISQTEND